MEIELTNVTEILEAIKEMSPVVWSVYLQQVQLEAYATLFKSFAWSLAAIVSIYMLRFAIRMGRRNYAKKDEELTMGYTFLSVVALIVFAGCIGTMISHALVAAKYYYNPSFYAIQMLLEAIQ